MKLAFVDLETTGLDAQHDEIIEVAIIIEQGEALHCSLTFDEAKLTAQAASRNKYYERSDELAAIHMDEHDAVVEIHRMLKGSAFIGNNPAFDARFLAVFLGTEPWHYHLVDLKALVAGQHHLLLPWSTAQIEKASGCQNNSAHTALGDAEWNQRVFRSLHFKEA